MSQTEKEPYIASSRTTRELNLRTIFFGFITAMLLCASNAYLGLFAGMTVSASIPAAVLGMAILKMFRNGTILECNGIQTAASAGEALAAGAIFTLPALLLMGFWTEFDFWQTFFITLSGGVIGVCFSIPLRQSLVVEEKLKYPEGIATAEVLITGFEGSKAVKFLLWGGIFGALLKFSQGGLKIVAPLLERAVIYKSKFLYFGIDFSPALIAVGFIVGLNVSAVMFAGAVISWWIAIPISISGMDIAPNTSIIDLGYEVWDSQIRYLGVGVMIVGGLWTLLKLRNSIITSARQGFQALINPRKTQGRTKRTEKDLSMAIIFKIIVLVMIPSLIFFYGVVQNVGAAIIIGAMLLVVGFLFSAVAGYMAGVVGSSNNPISAITIATMLLASFLLLAYMGSGDMRGPAAAILIGSVVCCAAAISGDNLQDLKAGHILGATPWRQQIMQFVGVIAASLVIAPVLNLLHTAYTVGSKELSAPQATLMKNVVEGVFGGKLPWNMIFWGGIIGIATIALDEYLQKTKASWRIPVLALAIGIYLPFELDSAIFLGGLIAYFASKAKVKGKKNKRDPKAGILLASGLITGETLMGIFLAVPVAIYGSTKVFAIEHSLGSATEWIAALAIGFLTWWMYDQSKGTKGLG